MGGVRDRALVEHLVQDHEALVGQAHLVGVGVFGRGAPPAVWALAAGIVVFAVVDCVFVYQAATGTFRPGTLLQSVSLATMAVVAAAGWLPDGVRSGRTDPLPNVVVPGLCALVCLGLLVFATRTEVPVLAVVLAGSGIAV